MWGGWTVGVCLVVAASTASAAPRAWIPNQMSNTVSRYDLATNEAVTFPTGEYPFTVAASPTRAFIGSDDGVLTIIDAVNDVVLSSLPIGSGRGIAITPDGSKVYLPRGYDVAVLDGSTGAVLDTVVMMESGHLGSVAVNPAGTRVYVGKYADNVSSIAVIDTATDTLISDIYLTEDASQVDSVAVSPDGTRVWAIVSTRRSAYVVDATTGLLIQEVPLLCGPECYGVYQLVVNPNGGFVYVGTQTGVDVIDTTMLASMGTLPTAGIPMSLDVSPDGTRLYIVETGGGPGRVEILDTSTYDFIGTFLTIGEGPTANGRFIVAGSAPTTSTSTTLATTTTSSTSTSTSTTTSTLPPLPLLGSIARACQDALVTSYKRHPAKAHKLFASCFGRVLRDAASGDGTAGAATACIRNLDPSNPSSALARTRSTARAGVLSKCAPLAPATLGHPCSADATDMAAVTDCVLDAQTQHVVETLRAQYGAPCTLAIAAGIDGMFPALCAP